MPESGIRSYGDFCVAPNNTGCSPPDGTYLIFTKKRGMACNATDMIFVFDQDGVIHHKCSKKVICPQGNFALFCFRFNSIFVVTVSSPQYWKYRSWEIHSHFLFTLVEIGLYVWYMNACLVLSLYDQVNISGKMFWEFL